MPKKKQKITLNGKPFKHGCPVVKNTGSFTTQGSAFEDNGFWYFKTHRQGGAVMERLDPFTCSPVYDYPTFLELVQSFFDLEKSYLHHDNWNLLWLAFKNTDHSPLYILGFYFDDILEGIIELDEDHQSTQQKII